MDILLSKEPLDEKDVGYQEPTPKEERTEKPEGERRPPA
jgi:hypothetical protein